MLITTVDEFHLDLKRAQRAILGIHFAECEQHHNVVCGWMSVDMKRKWQLATVEMQKWCVNQRAVSEQCVRIVGTSLTPTGSFSSDSACWINHSLAIHWKRRELDPGAIYSFLSGILEVVIMVKIVRKHYQVLLYLQFKLQVTIVLPHISLVWAKKWY